MKRRSHIWWLFVAALLLFRAIVPFVGNEWSRHLQGAVYLIGFTWFLYWNSREDNGSSRLSWVNHFIHLLRGVALYVLFVIILDSCIAVLMLPDKDVQNTPFHHIVVPFIYASIAFHFFVMVIFTTILFIFGRIKRK